MQISNLCEQSQYKAYIFVTVTAGLFDDLFTKDIPRKQRQSTDSSPCHSKQSSEGESVLSSKTSSTKDFDSTFDSDLKPVQDKKVSITFIANIDAFDDF